MRCNYNSSIEFYKQFITNHEYLIFPAIIMTITHWIANLIRNIKLEIAKTYLNTFRSYHLEYHFNMNIFHNQRIDLIIRDIKWYQSQKEKHLRLSLIYKILYKIIREYPPIFINNINIRVAICIEFAIFLHSREFIWDI